MVINGRKWKRFGKVNDSSGPNKMSHAVVSFLIVCDHANKGSDDMHVTETGACRSHTLLRGHQQRVDVLKALKLRLVDLLYNITGRETKTQLISINCNGTFNSLRLSNRAQAVKHLPGKLGYVETRETWYLILLPDETCIAVVKIWSILMVPEVWFRKLEAWHRQIHMNRHSLIIRRELNGLIGELGIKVIQPKLAGDVGLEGRNHLLLFHLKYS